jgi:DNA-binding response OmpR family regulator
MRGPDTLRVLVGEDDLDQREILGDILTGEGYQVELAGNANEFAQRLDRAELAILDLHGVSTPEVARALRAVQPRPKLLLVSGDPLLEAAARQLGADDFLGKPYDLDLLLARVAHLSGRP